MSCFISLAIAEVIQFVDTHNGALPYHIGILIEWIMLKCEILLKEKIMVCRLFGTKPLLKLMMISCEWDPYEETSNRFASKY